MPTPIENLVVGSWVAIVEVHKDEPKDLFRGSVMMMVPQQQGTQDPMKLVTGRPFQIHAISLPFVALYCPINEHVSPVDFRTIEVTKLDKAYVEVFLHSRIASGGVLTPAHIPPNIYADQEMGLPGYQEGAEQVKETKVNSSDWLSDAITKAEEPKPCAWCRHVHSGTAWYCIECGCCYTKEEAEHEDAERKRANWPVRPHNLIDPSHTNESEPEIPLVTCSSCGSPMTAVVGGYRCTRCSDSSNH